MDYSISSLGSIRFNKMLVVPFYIIAGFVIAVLMQILVVKCLHL